MGRIQNAFLQGLSSISTTLALGRNLWAEAGKKAAEEELAKKNEAIKNIGQNKKDFMAKYLEGYAALSEDKDGKYAAELYSQITKEAKTNPNRSFDQLISDRRKSDLAKADEMRKKIDADERYNELHLNGASFEEISDYLNKNYSDFPQINANALMARSLLPSQKEHEKRAEIFSRLPAEALPEGLLESEKELAKKQTIKDNQKKMKKTARKAKGGK